MKRTQLLKKSLFILALILICVPLISQNQDTDNIKLEDAINYLNPAENLEADQSRTFEMVNVIRKATIEDVPILIKALENSSTRLEVRILIAIQLGKLEAKDAGPVLIKITENKRENIDLRYKTARALGYLKDQKAIPVLSSIFKDSNNDRHLRIVSALALGDIGGEKATSSLLCGLKDSDYLIRFKTIQSLEKIKNPLIIKELENMLNDSNRFVKARAIHALGKIGDESVIPIIHNILKSDDSDFIHIACLTALGSLGGSEAEKILEQYVNDPSNIIKLNANSSLDQIKKDK